MSAPRRAPAKAAALPGAATAPLLYWLLLVCGLALLTVQRIDALPKVVPLWAGAAAGTALGQFLALKRLRFWLLTFVVANAMWVGAIVSAPLWLSFWAPQNVWDAVELSVISFAPAALCGYLSLSERAGLVAFWFPSVPWMLAILDGSGGLPMDGVRSWLLLGGLAALLLAFLHARESRRVALWKGHSLGRLAAFRSEAVLHEAPLRPAAPFAWVAGLGAATLALTGWVAPNLWHKDKAPPRPESAGGEVAAAGVAGGEPWSCCPKEGTTVERERVREYIPALEGRDAHGSAAARRASCVPCRNGVPVGGEAGTMGGTSHASTEGTAPAGSATTATQVSSASPSTPAAPGTAAPVSTASPAASPKPVASPRPPASPAKLPARARNQDPRQVARPPIPPPAAAAAAPLDPGTPLPWLLAAAIAGAAIHLGARPLRRHLTLRHLRRPLWREALDQRVSNLWELVLVGLRDGGWRPGPGEQPGELARRVGLPGLDTCALVLERARHGVRVDAADLAAMEQAAEAVYQAARRRAGWAARAAGWLRWPLR